MKNTVLFFFIIFSYQLFAQIFTNDDFIYTSPVNNSELILKKTEIILRPLHELKDSLKSNLDNFLITGSYTGIHNYTTYVNEKSNSFILKPIFPFSAGETVSIELKNKSKTKNGFKLEFQIALNHISKSTKMIEELFEQNAGTVYKTQSFSVINAVDDDLPDDMHYPIQTEINNPVSDKFYYLASWLFFAPHEPYLLVTDNSGNPVYYKKEDGSCYDFKRHPDGRMSYYKSNTKQFYLMNSNFEVYDTIICGYGYTTDLHELLFDENDHILIFSYDEQKYDMSNIVDGGDPEAIVTGIIIQELDHNREVIFQWRSWDHVQITDANESIDLTSPNVDYMHSNSICIDNDDNLLISSRHFSEITKIDRTTGEIIFRLGGKNNEFDFVNDDLQFTYQHDARRLPNGNISLFDNGNDHPEPFSSAKEYEIDEINKTANLVWDFSLTPSIWSKAICNHQKLPGGNRIISWGGYNNAAFTEVNDEGEILNNFVYDTNAASYRVYKDIWTPTYLTFSNDTINFGTVKKDTIVEQNIVLQNNTSNNITISSIKNNSSVFSLNITDSLRIPAFSADTIKVLFNSGLTEKTYNDTIKFYCDKIGERKTKWLRVKGIVSNVTSVEEIIQPDKITISDCYPNPFNSTTNFNVYLPQSEYTTIKVYDAIGNLVKELHNGTLTAGDHTFKLNDFHAASGIYFVNIHAGSVNTSRKILLLK